jgi:hypothetical protein
MTHTVGGTWRPALTYVCAALADAAPDPIYVRRIAAAARAHGLPTHHVKWIESTAAIPAQARPVKDGEQALDAVVRTRRPERTAR